MLMKQAVQVRDSGELESKMLQFRDETSRSPDFLVEANELLIECRRILKYTFTLMIWDDIFVSLNNDL